VRKNNFCFFYYVNPQLWKQGHWMVQSGAAWNRFSIAEKKEFCFSMLRLKMLNTI